jgi:hypothetical protein
VIGTQKNTAVAILYKKLPRFFYLKKCGWEKEKNNNEQNNFEKEKNLRVAFTCNDG